MPNVEDTIAVPQSSRASKEPAPFQQAPPSCNIPQKHKSSRVFLLNPRQQHFPPQPPHPHPGKPHARSRLGARAPRILTETSLRDRKTLSGTSAAAGPHPGRGVRNGGADALTRTATAPAQETAGADAGGLGGGRPPGTESRGCGGIPAGSPSVAAGPPGSLRPGAEEGRRHEPPLSPVPRTAGAAPRGYALHPNFFFFLFEGRF